jgi:hypothetical protein
MRCLLPFAWLVEPCPGVRKEWVRRLHPSVVGRPYGGRENSSESMLVFAEALVVFELG